MMFPLHILVPKLIFLLGLEEYFHPHLIRPRFMFTKWININVCHFLIHLLKMVSYNTYPPLLTEAPPPEAPPQIPYHLSMVQTKRRGLINKEVMFKKKYKKYNRILNRLMWLNACSSGISIATGISRVATFATFIRVPVNAA